MLEQKLIMNQRYSIMALLTLAGFIAGMAVAQLLSLSNWLTAKITVSLLTGIGFVVGHFLARRNKE
jgi:hypothetical protein